MDWKNASCRVAFAAMVHDLGKLVQRAGVEVGREAMESHRQLYAKRNYTDPDRFWYSHEHAVYTALGWDLAERHFPATASGDQQPFESAESGFAEQDSMVNAAAMHHAPQTLLQWIVATADRIASGFEREWQARPENAGDKQAYLKARLASLFEQIRLENVNGKPRPYAAEWEYPLTYMSAGSLFPESKAKGRTPEQARKEYAALWQAFLEKLAAIPSSHKASWPLWLDHFDSLWLAATAFVPSAASFGVKPDVSLYDHSKATAAIAVALWRYHAEKGLTGPADFAALKDRSDWSDKKLLLIQGDFTGIQNFIFSESSETNRAAAELLRGRSFYVSL
ncbi:MAG: type III-A CRISPR-associated protein Cas10/Csm1, partial [Duodenibacillus sp.]|nr:type III-A CRISPR-associated protein Cas10/Csm1 [Duodenibacillus sp.]